MTSLSAEALAPVNSFPPIRLDRYATSSRAGREPAGLERKSS
jgi:hypothetical protein